MADRIFEIEFKSTSTGDGAEKLVSDLDKLKQFVDQSPSQSLDTTTTQIKEVAKETQTLAEKIPVAEREMKRFLEANGMAAGKARELASEIVNTAGKAGGLKDALESVIGPATSGEFSINALKKSLFALGSESAAVSSLGIAGLVVGLGLLVKAAADSAEPIANFILSMDELMTSMAEVNFSRLEEAKLTLTTQNKAIDEHIEKLKMWAQLADEARKSEESLARTKNEATLAKATRESAERVAASGNDPAVIATENARLATLKATIDSDNTALAASNSLSTAKSKLSQLEGERVALSERIKKNEEARERALIAAGNAIAQYTKDEGDRARLSTSIAAIDEEIKTLKDDELKSIKQSILQRAKDYLQRSDEAKGQMEDDAKRRPVLDQEIITAGNALTEATLQLQIAQDKAATSMIDAGKEVGKGAETLKAAIADMQAKLVAAKESLAVARGSTGAPNAAAQGMAYAAVQNIEQQLAQLKAQEAAMTAAAGSYATTIKTGAESIARESQNAAASVQSATDKAAKTAKTGGEEITTAAAEFKISTVEGAKSMTGGIQDMATAVKDVTRGVAAEVKQLNVEVVGQFREMQRDINRVKEIAIGARRQADIATDQVAASR